MRILWITNIMLPPVCEALEVATPPTGGWMYSSLKKLCEHNQNVGYAVASVWKGSEFRKLIVDGVVYYLLPLKGKSITAYNKHLETYWREIKKEFNPDVVHIHGTEFPHGLAYIRSCGSTGVVASIQGIISCVARYYTAGIDDISMNKNRSFRDIIKCETISQGQKKFERRGALEDEFFQSLNHIIGRTDWDKAHAYAINPGIHYYYCGETLRDEFYRHTWQYEKCEPYSIFVSQAGYPIKGLHMLLKAMPLILRKYPDAKIYVAGEDLVHRPWYRITSYGKYIRLLIKQANLKDKIYFTGSLNEQQMCERYLKSNVFVCPSAIENSPNSLGEAQLLRMPHVASYVGGVPEITNMNSAILYRFEEYEMLAEKICEVFERKANTTIPKLEWIRYDEAKNCQDLINIYRKINSLKNEFTDN